MNTKFSEVFSGLRKERGLSQRQVAADLGLSQALLSHYENGIREPKLDFVIKACEYYDVSSDYLLGLTDIRKSPVLGPNLKNANVDRLIDSIAFILNHIARDGDVALAVHYLEASIFKLCGLSDIEEQALCDGHMKLLEAQLASTDILQNPSEQLTELISEMRELLRDYKR